MLINKKNIITMMIALAFSMELVFNWYQIPIFRSPKNIFLLIALIIYIQIAIKNNKIFLTVHSNWFLIIMLLLFMLSLSTTISALISGIPYSTNSIIYTLGAIIIFSGNLLNLWTEQRFAKDPAKTINPK